MKFLYAVTLVTFCMGSSFAQKQANQWYFGYGVGLNFNPGAPVPIIGSSLGTGEGCSSIADHVTGNVLFYSDGSYCYDRTNNVMPHGFNLGGNISTTQSALIVPDAWDTTKYFLFSVDDQTGYFNDGSGGVSFNTVNMTLNGGLGDIDTTSSFNWLDEIIYPVPATEKIAATSDGFGYWVVFHQWNTNTFIAVDAGPTPNLWPVVFSNSGIVHYSVNGGQNTESIGCMEFSPNGTKLAVAVFEDLNTLQIFDFDNTTGIVSNPITDTNFHDDANAGGAPYGVSFSPDNSKLYVSTLNDFGPTSYIYQYNMLAGDSTAIIASRVVIDSSDIPYGTIQIAPDGKIYIAKEYSDYIDVIENPDGLGAACNYNPGGQYVGYNSILGLPNLPIQLMQPVNFGSLTYTGCSGSNTLSFGNSTITGSVNYFWNFGDPASGASNTSSLQYPSHTFSSSGSYTVQLVFKGQSTSDTVSQVVVISGGSILSLAPQSPAICNGQSVALKVSGGTTYSWSPSTALSATSGDSVVANPTVTTIYSISGGCTLVFDTVTVNPSPDLNVMPTYGNVCIGQSTQLKISGADSYRWSPSTTLSADSGSMVVASPTTTTTYNVVGSDGNCRDSLLSIIIVNLFPVLNISPVSPTICSGQSITLKATGATNYQWIGTNDNTDSLAINPERDTTYELIASNGTCASDTLIPVKVNPTPKVTVTPNTICSGQSGTLIAAGASTYQWSPSTGLNITTGDSVISTITVATTYTVIGTTGGCSDTLQTSITIAPSPNKPVITKSVTGDTLFSSARNGNQWFKNDTVLKGATDSILVIKGQPAATYQLVVTDVANGCTSTSDSLVTTGIGELAISANRVSVYPNPTNGLLNVTIDPSALTVNDWSLQLIDVLGRIRYTMSPLNPLKGTFEIDLSNLPGGIYFITIINNTGRMVFPIVKQN